MSDDEPKIPHLLPWQAVAGRKLLDWSQEDLAAAVSASRTVAARFEVGGPTRRIFALAVADALAKHGIVTTVERDGDEVVSTVTFRQPISDFT